jgi:peroxiredoxin
MIRVGDRIPETELRTDEGTPLALSDLEGRALAIFLTGEGDAGATGRLLDALGESTGRFWRKETSPVVLLVESVEDLSRLRRKRDLPFLLVSDPDGTLHTALRGGDGERVAAILVDPSGSVRDIIPALPPVELVRMTLARMSRAADE